CQLCYFPVSWRAISPVHTPAILRGSLVPELGFGVHGASRSQSSFKPVAQRVLRFSVLGSNSVTKMGVMLQKGATNGEECMSRSGKNSVLLVLLGWFLATLAFAQGGATGAITGTVQDPTGAVVANAEVRIVNQDTGVVTRTAKTDANGSFTAPPDSPGNTELRTAAHLVDRGAERSERLRPTWPRQCSRNCQWPARGQQQLPDRRHQRD